MANFWFFLSCFNFPLVNVIGMYTSFPWPIYSFFSFSFAVCPCMRPADDNCCTFFCVVFFFSSLSHEPHEVILLHARLRDVSVNVEKAFFGMGHPQVDKSHYLAIHLPYSFLAKTPCQ